MNADVLPRLAATALARHLRVMPVTVLGGARQTGKSTLAHVAGGPTRLFMSLDDASVAELAARDPGALLAGREPVTIDEIQRATGLLRTVKQAIDRKRANGRVLLTGSANLLTMAAVTETLAGRGSYLTLWPMTRREQLGLGRAGLWDELLAADDSRWPGLLAADRVGPEDWKALARRGGFPTPALQLVTDEDRAIWFEGYVRTYLERDLRALSSVASLPDFRRLMRAAALRIGQLVNQAELGRDIGVPQPTVHRHLNLLETSYMLVRLPAFAPNRTTRLIKTPKLYWSDPGLAMHLAGIAEPAGQHLESIVLHDLLVWRDAQVRRSEVCYWRTPSGAEVDFVLEHGHALLPVEVKATARPGINDTAGLRAFREAHGKRSRAGLLLHCGTETSWILPGILAAPWWRVI
jgi:predicted AAA+ superfamily ATPase